MNGPTPSIGISPQFSPERLKELEAGALILIEDTRYRVRKLPIGGRA